ncbi:MAG: 7-cyano-7-deazaguanine synthase [Phycisphaerae bacterium]|nr:7-cyano-7-deazaguanine synthase [Phycisphaerae bacterium]
MDKAVVLASGGVNSTVAVALTREQYTPYLLHVNWGHRSAEREAIAFQQTASAMGIENTMLVEIPGLAALGTNARASRRLSIEDATTLEKGTPATFALALLPSMLSAAASWAGCIGARRIVVGVSEDHGVPGPAISEFYPDHRIEFIQTFNLMLKYAMPADRELVVEAPLLEMTRAEVVRLGMRLEVPFKLTWSCYANNEKPCNRCLACHIRAMGFLQARLPDPLVLSEKAVVLCERVQG